MARKKKRDFKFYWEEPEQPEEKQSIQQEPFEFKFTFPRLRFPEMKRTSVNIEEKQDRIVVTAEMPGFKREEIALSISGSMVEIAASKRQEKVEKGDRYFRHEQKAGAIRRAFTLPAPVDVERAEARLSDGVLIITAPKGKETKKKKRIDVE